MNYIKKSNKTEKTAEIYVPYKKKAEAPPFHNVKLQSAKLERASFYSRLQSFFITVRRKALTGSPVAACPVSWQVGRA